MKTWLLRRYVAFCHSTADALGILNDPQDDALVLTWWSYAVVWLYMNVAFPLIHRLFTDDEIWAVVLED
jgi:hypothetical protein